jgi:predicted dehydrogenase
MKRRRFIKTTALGNAGIITAPVILAGRGWKGTDKKPEKIKIAQIGVCHEHASGKINTLKKMPDVYEIVGIVDDRDTMAAKFAGNDLKSYEGLKWISEEELFNTPGLQAAAVETPNTDLVPTAIRCMEHNLAMHMDKPGGEDLELFGKLLKGCKERNLPFQMGYMFRNNPAMQFCRKAVREGWLGYIFEVQADMSHNYGGEAYQRYLSNFRGGIMFNLGCHLIDFIISMLGRPEKVTPFLKSTPGAANGAKNNCLAVLEYPHTIVSLSACDLGANGVNHDRRLKICGSRGAIELSPLEHFDGKPLQMELILHEGNDEYSAGSHTLDFGIKSDRYEDQLLELAKIIRGEMKNPYTYEHDYLTQEIVLAASGYVK